MFPAIIFSILLISVKAEYFVIDEECLDYVVYPVQYDIILYPHIYNNQIYNYNCDITISIIANHPNVRIIELDAKDIDINSASVKVMYGNKNIVSSQRPYEFDNRKGKLYIYLKEDLLQYRLYNAVYLIQISFKKNVMYDTSGIFVVSYDERGMKHLFTTRLSPNKAKYFIPCFDNPHFESGFKFKVYEMKPQPGLQFTNTSLVIAKELNRHTDNNYIVIDYITSPQVALYEVGFHHSLFGSRMVTGAKSNDTIIIWAQKSTLEYYTFILNFGESIINLIHDYSNNSVPLVYGPINIVSVPTHLNGYEIGSWNLLTNGDNRLAYVQHFTSIIQLEAMTFELTQQLCRIWLGNPGEMKRTRWTEEWFKEGVATYLTYYFLGQYNNGAKTIAYNWPIGKFGIQMKHKAMEEDWHHGTPALITFNRTLAVEIPPRYQNLVAMKTASLLWMVENWLGSEKFHRALVKYINSRRGKRINVVDFTKTLDIEAIECESQLFNGTTASKVLYSWFVRPGYPVINVNVLRGEDMSVVQLKQRQFSFTGQNRKDTDFLIPISYVVQNSHDCFNCYQPRFTIRKVYTFKEKLNGGWIILNRNASGYYRVNYDEVTWKLIAKTLKENHHAIEELNRAQIVNDVFTLYAAGDIDVSLAMELLDYLDNEHSDIVWQAAIQGFELLKIDGAACNMHRNLYDQWQEFMQRKVSKIYKVLVNDLEQQKTIRLFRSHLLDFACGIKYQPCLEYMRDMLQKERIDPDSRVTCYRQLMNDNDGWEHNLVIKNRFEVEDKMVAERRIQEERRFLDRRLGPPRPMPIILPATATAPVPTQIPEVTTKKPGSSSATLLTSTVLIISNFIACLLIS